ncbi:hypothetical protein GCM10007916_34100 [Psychromonas marina]|uniref:Flavinylation-associated cytochrome domain-containing protein n=1 Tax=Psychromonas marina TaxID=88364 RepID=A0ABQ6E4L8_9GAMM|nr:DUF4405 domain-containing protein [Psychromonas marina]GLS92339.1 hypothetical protein GCM10007916_34100 [Psychromonas marina]
MKSRRITALTAFLTFFIMLFSSIVLYIAPQGRVAYWANWTLGELSKEQWADIHINTGIVFLLALSFHLYLNFKAIKTYLKTRDRKFKIFTIDFNIALLITIACVVGTYMKIPPFSSMLSLSEAFKESTALTYGEPPYGHAEQSTLNSYCKKMGLNLEETIKKIKAAGYSVESSELQIKQIATQNNVSPQQLLFPLTPDPKFPVSNSNAMLKIPEDLSGVGRLTLVDLKEQYNADSQKIIAVLKAKGIKLDESTKIKEIAEDQDMSAHDLFDQIREIHNQTL